MTVASLNPLTQRYIFSFWLPLAASWVLMSMEGPFVQAAINRLPGAETNLAALGIVTSLEITIEAPIIMILATSTALCRDRAAYQVLRRFMLGLNLVLTIVAAVVAFTSVYDWIVPGLMGVPDAIAAAARPGMQIMTLWSAAIGWRRFYQGILIRFGQTRKVSYGTVVRLLSSAGTAAVLTVWGEWPGVWVGSCGLMAGVLAEAVFVTWIVRPTIDRHLTNPASQGDPLTMRRVIGFHSPLAATSLLMLFSQPLISAGLARAASPEQSLAAWPVVSSLSFVARSFGIAAQEVVIALTDGPEALEPVRRFIRTIGISAVLLLALITFTPLAGFYLQEIADVPTRLISFVISGLQAALLLPGFTAVQSWLRALLMKGESTSSIYQAMGINLIITIVALVVGVAVKAPGVQMAAVVLTLAMGVELVFLGWRVRSVWPSALLA